MYKLSLIFVACASYLTLVNTAVLTDDEMKELMEAPFITVPIEEEGTPEARSLKESLLNAKRMCECTDIECKCCTEYKVLFTSASSCIHLKLVTSEKAFDTYITVVGKKIFNTRIDATDIEKMCGKVPHADGMEICIHSVVEEHKADGFTMCMSLDVTFKEQLLANINFQCLKYENKKLHFEPNNKTGKDALATLSVKSPLELLAKLIKAGLKSLDD